MMAELMVNTGLLLLAVIGTVAAFTYLGAWLGFVALSLSLVFIGFHMDAQGYW